VGAPTGGLDQTTAVHAQAHHALLIDFSTGTHEQVPFDPGRHGLALLVIDTGVSHELTDGGYGSRREECDRAARMLGVDHLAASGTVVGLPAPLDRRARHVVSEMHRVDDFVRALRADDWTRIGPLMDSSHASLRDDFEVSCAELDVAVDAARAAGALGARMTGGGFGGSAIALVPASAVDQVRAIVSERFGDRGWRSPDFFLAEPGPGARCN
jgi:galactokinase